MTKPLPSEVFPSRKAAGKYAYDNGMIIDRVTPIGGHVKILEWHSKEDLK